MRRLNLIYLLLIIVVSLFGVKALFHPGFYTSHDGEHQVLRLYHFDRAVKDGQIPPRWADYQILNGHGYPLFIFSYHAPWIMAEPLRLIHLPLTTTVKIIFILTFTLSGLFMFLWVRKLFGDLPAFIGSILYLWAPYRFSNIFVRASLGEATVFMFLPLVLYGLEKLKERQNLWGILIGSVGISGLILSHIMASLIFVLPILFYLLIYIWLSKRKRLDFKRVILPFLFGFSLSAYYLLPAFFEKKFTKFSLVYPSMFRDHFVTLRQLIYSRWGYGFSFPGVEQDEMAFQIGAAQWISVFLALFLMAGLFLFRRVTRRDRRPFFLGIGFHVSFFLSVLMMLKASNPFWRLITQVFPFDFPWRFLGLSIFTSSFLSALTIFYLKKLNYQKAAFILSLFLIALTFYANRNHLQVNQYVFYNDSHYEKITNSTSSYDELVPVWAKGEILSEKREPVEVLKGDVSVRSIKRKSDKISFETICKEKEALLRINTLFFPGWKLFVNGKKVNFDFKNSGMVEFNPPVGISQVLLVFTKTPLRAVSDIISVSTSIFLVLWALKFLWR